MKVRFHPTLESAGDAALGGSCAVVIDVLRSSSSIVAALENGAKRVLAVQDVETACRLAGGGDRGMDLLAGEMKGLPIEGFDLGNSPLDLTSDNVAGKTVILRTSNGTRAIAASASADRVLVCAINNVGAVAVAADGEAELAVICCGSEGDLSAEDLLCGGMLLEILGPEVDLVPPTDGAGLAAVLANRFGADPLELLRWSDRGRALISLGLERDLIYCAEKDRSCCVPELKDGALSL